MARSTEEVFQHHDQALSNGDFPALMSDYADDAVLMTMEGAVVGKAAIQEWFIQALSSMPNTTVTATGHRVHGDYILLTWTATSDVATVPNGVDTFVISDDKIRLQTVWFTTVPK